MGLFRPSRKVTDPGGREWEIYVLRYGQPSWQPGQYQSFADDFADSGLRMGLLFPIALLIDLASFVLHQVLVPAARFVVVLPVAVLRGKRGRKIWIEAISLDLAPYKEVIVWTTTPDQLERVLDQVTAGLAAGEVARPLGAVLESRSR
jgi:hypothetical protein